MASIAHEVEERGHGLVEQEDESPDGNHCSSHRRVSRPGPQHRVTCLSPRWIIAPGPTTIMPGGNACPFHPFDSTRYYLDYIIYLIN